MLFIPMLDLPSFIEQVTLDNVPYILNFKWVARGPFWIMDFSDREQNPLLTGIKISLFYELITRYPDRGLPPGQLYAGDDSEDKSNLGREDFVNGRASLIYVPEAEVATF